MALTDPQVYIYVDSDASKTFNCITSNVSSVISLFDSAMRCHLHRFAVQLLNTRLLLLKAWVEVAGKVLPSLLLLWQITFCFKLRSRGITLTPNGETT